LTEGARLLVSAQNPVIIADRLARTPAGMAHLMELAELLQAPVIDQGGRMNFPTPHPLNMSNGGRALLANAGRHPRSRVDDFWGTVDSFRDSLVRSSRPLIKPGTKVISITAGDLFIKSNYQDFQRYPEVDIAMAADGEATLPRSSRR
jgi:thiamine pyrophosphate-dependent acetolactate synthase large subunit-like protein